MNPDERRKQERHKIWVHAEVQTPVDTFNMVVSEISADGLKIQSKIFIPPGLPVRVDLKLQEKVEIEGDVVWALSTLDVDANVYVMGILTDTIFYEGIKVNKSSTRLEAVQRIISRMK